MPSSRRLSLPVRPVVVGVDGSESAFAAVEWAARHASRAGSTLRIVHAFGWPLVCVSSGPAQWTRGLQDEAWTFIEEARTRASAVDPDLEVAVAVPTSFSAPQLLRESAAASLVVVGTHGLSGFSGLVIGSTGVRLAARAEAPIVVVRGRPADDIDRNGPVLVGYDGSAVSDLAVTAGFEYATLHKRSVSLLHVSSVGAGPDDITRRMVDLAATWHRVRPDVDVNSREANGHPAGVLTESSQDAALVVVGSRGRGGFRGLVLGSVSQALLHHAHCPVMVLPPMLLAQCQDADPSQVPRAGRDATMEQGRVPAPSAAEVSL